MSEQTPLTRDELIDLIASLHGAAEKYYQDTGVESPMTDEQFDSGIELLRDAADSGTMDDLFGEDTTGYALLEGSPSLGTTPQTAHVVEHKHPMLSLNKAKTEDVLQKYLDKAVEHGITEFKLQAKLDGMAMSAVYVDGQLIQLARRGDGHRGDDTTFALRDPNLTIVGLPDTVEHDGRFEVRGELFFTDENFQAADTARYAVTGERFKNSRNSVSGILMRSEAGLEYQVTLNYAAYSVIHDDTFIPTTVLDDRFLTTDQLTAQIVEGVTNLSVEEVFPKITAFGAQREHTSYPTDGVVVKPQDEMTHYATMGISAHAPESQIAWKYPAEQAQTVIRDVSVTVGKTGRLTPVAHVDPVELDGSTVENASLHNYNLVYEKDIRIGSIVAIEKANDIIPQILHVIHHVDGSERIMPPTACPVCGTAVETLDQNGVPLKSILCENVDCESRVLFTLQNAVSKSRLDIDRMSEVSIEYLYGEGLLTTVADFYTLDHNTLANSRLGFSAQGTPRRMGEKTAAHVVHHIEASKTAPFDRLLASLGIPAVGVRVARSLQAAFTTFDDLRSATVEELDAVDGIGEVMAERIRGGLAANRETIDRMIAAGVQFEIPAPVSVSVESKIAGVSVSISGSVPERFANRQEFVAWVEEHGGEFHSSPKKATNLLIGDPNGSSSKIQKAIQNGTTVMTPEDFAAQYM